LDSENSEVSVENTKLMRSSFQEMRVFVGIDSCSEMVSQNQKKKERKSQNSSF